MMTSRALSLAMTCMGFATLANDAASAQNMQYQPRPQFQNQPNSPCSGGPIRRGDWTPLGIALTQDGNRVEVYINGTTLQAMSYFTRAANRPIFYLKVDIQLRGPTGVSARERIMLDGQGGVAPISGVTEGELRQNVDNYLERIAARSVYALVEQHLRERRCFG